MSVKIYNKLPKFSLKAEVVADIRNKVIIVNMPDNANNLYENALSDKKEQ